MAEAQALLNLLQTKFAPQIREAVIQVGELTIEVESQHLLDLCRQLRDDADLRFEMLIDLCGVDYLHYGLSEWETESATSVGFSRGVEPPMVQTHCVDHSNAPTAAKVFQETIASTSTSNSNSNANPHANPNTNSHPNVTPTTNANPNANPNNHANANPNANPNSSIKPSTGASPCWTKPRFAVVYHLLSLAHNHRLRVRTFAAPVNASDPVNAPAPVNIPVNEGPEGLQTPPVVPSVIKIWNSANWYEREAFDLYGILFENHPDLRRILTDYGFIGYPFRKDFPLIGTVEMRYSAKDHRVIYEPVSIPPRTLVPKTIRDDNRYLIEKEFQSEKADKHG